MNTLKQNQKNSFIYTTALMGLISPIIWVIIIIILGFVYPGYNHLENFMSTLGAVGAPYAVVQRFNFFQFGITIILLGLSLFKKMENPSSGSRIMMIIIGAGIFLSGVFSEDTPNPEAFTSIMHGLVGLPAFLLIIFVPFVMGRTFDKNEEWKDLSFYSKIMSPLFFIFLVLMIASDTASWGLTGLFQRFFIGLWLVWIELISYRLYNLEI